MYREYAFSLNYTWLILQIPKFVSRNSADMMHKLLDLQNFSVYWDTDAAQVGHLPMSELAVSRTNIIYFISDVQLL